MSLEHTMHLLCCTFSYNVKLFSVFRHAPLIHDDYLKQKVVGHVFLYLTKIFFRFLKVLDCSTSAIVIGN